MRTPRIDLRRRRFISAVLASAIGAGGARARSPERFRVFDALLHRGKPDLTRDGLEPMVPVAGIWRAGISHNEFDAAGVDAALDRVPAGATAIYIDIENWPLLPVDLAIRDASIGKLMRVAERVRHQRPEVTFGFYGAPPINVYWPIMHHDSSYQQWLEADLAMAPLARLVDFLLPSLYTHYDDRRGWLRFAAAQIDAARRYGKPVYPFLWYEYHDSNRLLRGHDVAPDAWEEELRFCRAHADGIVLWGGAGRGWSESAVWWQTTRRVLDLPGPQMIT